MESTLETTDAEHARSRRRRRRRIAAGVVLFAAFAFFGAFHRFFFLGNVGVVVDGAVYRSAQPFHDVERLAADYGIKSILNLRGGSAKDPWYVDEVQASERLGIELFDRPMSAVRRPRRKDLLAILDVLDRCRYPLLIHCKSGSDRTGMAVGLYLMAKRGLAPDAAVSAFSLGHGHVPLFGPERLHEPFDEYAAWLKAKRLPHDPTRLREWVTNEYRADDPPTPALANRGVDVR